MKLSFIALILLCTPHISQCSDGRNTARPAPVYFSAKQWAEIQQSLARMDGQASNMQAELSDTKALLVQLSVSPAVTPKSPSSDTEMQDQA